MSPVPNFLKLLSSSFFFWRERDLGCVVVACLSVLEALFGLAQSGEVRAGGLADEFSAAFMSFCN